MPQFQTFISNITKKAGDTALGYFKKSGLKYAQKKNETDIVTEADHASNKLLINAIKKKYPAHGIISEETGEERASAEYVWIIDPLDGTRNFFTHTPLWGVMVGLAHKKKMLAAAIYDPTHKELAYAERGKGAFLNGKKTHCSTRKSFVHSYGTMSALWTRERIKLLIKTGEKIRRETVWVGTIGSAAMTALSVATGRRDWHISSGEYIWDYAIPSLVCEEAGCTVTDLKGKPWRVASCEIVAANPILHKELMKLLQ